MSKRTIRDLELSGKRLLMRVDFNVPLQGRRITDDARIQSALPTIRYALQQHAKVILMSHLGRPKGQVVESLRLTPVAERLSALLGLRVRKLGDCVGPKVEKAVAEMDPGHVILLENLRFHPGEEKNDPEFVQQLAALGDVYVSDAFGTVQRVHASIVGLTEKLPSAAGLLLEKELRYLGRALAQPEKPFHVILGGAKVKDKIPVVENLLNAVDVILIGGAMAYTFLKAQGLEVGRSVVDEKRLELAGEMLKAAKNKGVEILLPVDHVIADDFDAAAKTKIVEGAVPDGWFGLDIGPRTAEQFVAKLEEAKTVVWNGPMGVFEMEAFAEGTREVAMVLARSSATTIIGGGDTGAALKQFGVADKMTHVSTGGGASLEFLEGKELPGVAVLPEAD